MGKILEEEREAEILLSCPLFEGVDREDIGAMLDCLEARKLWYSKDDFVLLAGDTALYVAIVLTGGVKVIQEDYWGNRSILAHIDPAGLFGEAFACAGAKSLPVSAVASQDSRIMLINYNRITDGAGCEFHGRLISNMLQILARKNIYLTQKLEHMSKRSIREKLLSFLSHMAVETGSNELSIPYNRQELADFLGVERSALSRELGSMKNEGLLDYKKNSFLLK